MTVEEFEDQKATLACQLCGHLGLVAVHVVNNNGVRPGCPGCGCNAPLPGVQWLKQSKDRKVKRPSNEPTTEEVWEANGNTCAFCGKRRDECERFKIGLTKQHVVPFVEGRAGPLIPFCARCQQASVAALAETQRIRHYLNTLEEQIARIRRNANESA